MIVLRRRDSVSTTKLAPRACDAMAVMCALADADDGRPKNNAAHRAPVSFLKLRMMGRWGDVGDDDVILLMY